MEIGLERLQRRRDQRKELKDLSDQVKEGKKKSFQKLVQKREEKKEREESNKLKGMEFQVIKNNDKIKKWSKKARERLMKMPKEMFE